MFSTSNQYVATSGQGYSSLAFAQSSTNATDTALTTAGTYNRPVHPGTVGNRLREAGNRARRPYVGPPLTQAGRMYPRAR